MNLNVQTQELLPASRGGIFVRSGSQWTPLVDIGFRIKCVGVDPHQFDAVILSDDVESKISSHTSYEGACKAINDFVDDLGRPAMLTAFKLQQNK